MNFHDFAQTYFPNQNEWDSPIDVIIAAYRKYQSTGEAPKPQAPKNVRTVCPDCGEAVEATAGGWYCDNCNAVSTTYSTRRSVDRTYESWQDGFGWQDDMPDIGQ